MNSFNSTNEPQLHDAAPLKEISEFERLTGINPNTRDMFNNTPLHNAKNLSSVQVLLQAGADIHVINDFNEDPLQSILVSRYDISYSELFEIVRLFVDAGADVNWCNQRGWHRLWSIAFSSADAVKILLHFGADPCKTEDNGETALHAAAFMGGFEYEEEYYEEQARTIELLINAGADVHAKTTDGQTPLHSAAYGDGASQTAVRTLLKYGDDPLLADDRRMTALDYAINLYKRIHARKASYNQEDDKHISTEEYKKQLKKEQMIVECLRLLEEALKIKPDCHRAWLYQGKVQDNFKRYSEAIACYDEALKIKPDYYDAWLNRGIVLNDLGQYLEAVSSLEEALKIKPDNAYAWLYQGIVQDNLGQYSEAIASYNNALKIEPDYYNAWIYLGIAQDNLGQYSEAIASCNEALKIEPDNEYALLNRGIAQDNLGQYSEAIASYDEALKIKPDYYDALLYRGKAQNNLERYLEAIASGQSTSIDRE